MTSSVGPDQMVSSDLDLHCLQRYRFSCSADMSYGTIKYFFYSLKREVGNGKG